MQLPDRVDTIKINHNNITDTLKFLPSNQAIRYLGAWTTTDGNSDWGLELLKQKIESRLEGIKKLRVHAIQKAHLIKGKIMSAWSYTAAIQNIKDEEINKLESLLCQAVTSSDINITTRRDLLFEKKSKGGINSNKLT